MIYIDDDHDHDDEDGVVSHGVAHPNIGATVPAKHVICTKSANSDSNLTSSFFYISSGNLYPILLNLDPRKHRGQFRVWGLEGP